MMRVWGVSVLAVAAFMMAGCAEKAGEPATKAEACLKEPISPVRIKGGTFRMGAGGMYPEEGPVVEITVDDFDMDAHEVTNAQFRAFVEETGYVTVAERQPDPANYPDIPAELLVPGSAVFVMPEPGAAIEPMSWWQFVPGANWRHPEGPDSSIEGKDHYPVAHVAYEDAVAYAQWAGRALPTEEQWEYAARGGLEDQRFAWGNEFRPDGKIMANSWQGRFPEENTGEDGYPGLAPVGCFPANGYGLHDMIGNVWEWTVSSYRPGHGNDQARPLAEGPFVNVIKGGSYLCAANYCMRYRPAARHPQEVDLGSSNVGFRTVSRPAAN